MNQLFASLTFSHLSPTKEDNHYSVYIFCVKRLHLFIPYIDWVFLYQPVEAHRHKRPGVKQRVNGGFWIEI